VELRRGVFGLPVMAEGLPFSVSAVSIRRPWRAVEVGDSSSSVFIFLHSSTSFYIGAHVAIDIGTAFAAHTDAIGATCARILGQRIAGVEPGTTKAEVRCGVDFDETKPFRIGRDNYKTKADYSEYNRRAALGEPGEACRELAERSMDKTNLGYSGFDGEGIAALTKRTVLRSGPWLRSRKPISSPQAKT